MATRNELIGATLTLVGLGVAAGQRDTGFQLDGWVLTFWSLASVVAAWLVVSHLRHTPNREPTAAPNVVFDRVEHCDITLNAPNGQEVHVWELWFKNKREVQRPESTANQLTAEVEFCDTEWRQQLRFVGQWANTRMPEHKGWTSIQDRCDLPPVHTWAKLLLIAEDDTESVSGRWSEPDSSGEREWVEVRRNHAYGLAGENLHHAPGTADHVAYALPEDVSRVRITLTALNMSDRIYQFRLDRTATGK